MYKGVGVMDYKSIGRKIAKARNQKGLTQEQLAEKVDSNSGYISNIETAKKKPSLGLLIRIVNVLDLSLDYLLVNNMENKKFKNVVQIIELYKEIQMLDEDDKKLFYNVSSDIIKRLLEE